MPSKEKTPSIRGPGPTLIRDLVEFFAIRETHPSNWEDDPKSPHDTRKVKDAGAFLWVLRRYDRKMMYYALKKGSTYKVVNNIVIIHGKVKEPPEL